MALSNRFLRANTFDMSHTFPAKRSNHRDDGICIGQVPLRAHWDGREIRSMVFILWVTDKLPTLLGTTIINPEHIEAGTKCLTFCKRHLRMHFLEWKVSKIYSSFKLQEPSSPGLYCQDVNIVSSNGVCHLIGDTRNVIDQNICFGQMGLILCMLMAWLCTIMWSWLSQISASWAFGGYAILSHTRKDCLSFLSLAIICLNVLKHFQCGGSSWL